MSDTSPEDQAALAIVFEENIRELVRKHLKEALEDKVFVDSLFAYPLTEAVSRGLNTSSAFNSAVRGIIIQQMQKY
jgi:hypothetical protein